jgi:hypothetical protein|tara:strand:- start:469 stop:672 length:204 start_codon:yes stop_codon:yes gene_type:complete
MFLSEAAGLWGTITKKGSEWVIRGPGGAPHKIEDQSQIEHMGLKRNNKVAFKMISPTSRGVEITRKL